MKTSKPLRFLADRMLGRLGKWLCIMGQDCVYVRRGSPEDIVEQALSQNRILLTRDTRMIRRKRLGQHLFITSEHLERQLIQVIQIFHIDPLVRAFSRCLRCNLPLLPAEFKQANAQLPDHVHQTQKRLAMCPGCNRLFWAATHRIRMKKKLVQLKQAALPYILPR